MKRCTIQPSQLEHLAAQRGLTDIQERSKIQNDFINCYTVMLLMQNAISICTCYIKMNLIYCYWYVPKLVCPKIMLFLEHKKYTYI